MTQTKPNFPSGHSEIGCWSLFGIRLLKFLTELACGVRFQAYNKLIEKGKNYETQR